MKEKCLAGLVILIAVAAAARTSPASAEEVLVLTDGREFKGFLMEETDTEFVFLVVKGSMKMERRFPKDQVKEIREVAPTAPPDVPDPEDGPKPDPGPKPEDNGSGKTGENGGEAPREHPIDPPPLPKDMQKTYQEGIERSFAASAPAAHIVSRDQSIRWIGILGDRRGRHASQVFAVAASPDGSWLASACEDGTIRISDSATLAELRPVAGGHRGVVRDVAVSADGSWIVSAGEDQRLLLWESATGALLSTEETPKMEHKSQVWAVATSPDGKWIVSGGADKVLTIWDAATRTSTYNLTRETAVTTVAFGPDSKWVVSGEESGKVTIHDAESGGDLYSADAGNRVNSVAVSPDSKTVYVAAGPAVLAWEPASGGAMRTIGRHDEDATSVVAGPKGSPWIASGGRDGRIRWWDPAGKELRKSPRLTPHILDLATGPGGDWIASANIDETILLWDSASGRERPLHAGHDRPIESLDITPDGAWLASSSQDGTARLWDAKAGAEIRVLERHAESARGVAISPDGGVVVTGSRDKTVKVWDARSGKELRSIRSPVPVNRLAMAKEGKWILAAGEDDAVIWETETGKLVRKVSVTGGEVDLVAIAISADGKKFAMTGDGSSGTAIKVFNLDSGAEMKYIGGGSNVAAFNLDGKNLLTSPNAGDAFGIIGVWDIATATGVKLLGGHTQTVHGMAMSADGKYVYAVADDKTLRVWDFTVEPLDPTTKIVPELDRIALDDWPRAMAIHENRIWVGMRNSAIYVYEHTRK